MFYFFHNFEPTPILVSFGFFTIYWYGFFIVTGVLLGLAVIVKLAKKHQIPSETIIDLAFWSIIFGLIGARVYHVFLEYAFYVEHPWQIFQVWKGGIAIHGGMIGGGLAFWYFSRKKNINFWLFTALAVPGLALAQAIGRWGNYFNQEIFGLPTNLPWGIPILIFNRPIDYIQFNFFHPTFLYESLGCLIIFLVLIILHSLNIKIKRLSYKRIVAVYLFLYSVLRFSLEFIRIDHTLEFFGLRVPQIASLLLVGLSVYLWFTDSEKGVEKK